MAASADPGFEFATIRLSDPDGQNSGFHIHGHRISCERHSLNDMLLVAYGIHARQVVGGPTWFASDLYDVDGVPDVEGEPNVKQMQSMYRKLLADRFGLKFHIEKKSLPVYAIGIARNGSKLLPSAHDPNGLPDSSGNQNGLQVDMAFTNTSIALLALDLQFYVDRPVVDHTGLAGKYDFRLRWNNDVAESTDPNAPPTLSTAMQDELGLKLEATHAMVDAYVIDHVERPSAN